MKKKKIITTLLISTLALSSLLTACGTKKNTSENVTEVVTEVETQSLQSEAGASIEGTNLEGLTFNQSVAEDSSEVKNLLTNSGIEYSDVILYDFNLTDANNEKVQPNGSVTITFTPELANPNRDGATSTYAVYYYDNENGTISPMETTSNGDEVTFTTTHFSYYALARAIHVTNEDGTTSLLEYVDDEGNYLTWNEKEELRAKKEQAEQESMIAEENTKKANSSTTNNSNTTSNNTNSSEIVASDSSSSSASTDNSANSSTNSTSTTPSDDDSYYYYVNIVDGVTYKTNSGIKKGTGELLYTGTNGKLYISDLLNASAYQFFYITNDGEFHRGGTCYKEERYKTVSEGHGDLTFAEKTQEYIENGLFYGYL